MLVEIEPKVPWKLSDALSVIGLAIVVGVVSIIIAFALVGMPEEGEDLSDPQLVAGISATLAFDAILLGLAIAFTVIKYRVRWSELGFRRPRWGGWWLPFATLIVLWIVLGVYVAMIQGLDIERLEPQSTLEEDIFETPLIIVLAAVLALIAAPLAEETFFRGFLFPGLRDRWGLWIAAVASGLLFGLVHFDLGSIIPFSIIGIVLALAYAVSGSLWVSIATHFLFNFVSFVATLALQNGAGT